MSETLDAAWLREVVYVVVGAVAVVWAVREHRFRGRRALEWWPVYWWTSAAFLVAMAGARLGALEDLVAEIGRDQARAGGWYAHRRLLQGPLVVGIALTWLIGVIAAVWRVPPRRRRYLPHAVGISALMAFAAIRVISFHYVDAVLYRRDIAGVRFVAIVELGLLAATAVIGVVTARFPTTVAGEPDADAADRWVRPPADEVAPALEETRSP